MVRLVGAAWPEDEVEVISRTIAAKDKLYLKEEIERKKLRAVASKLMSVYMAGPL